MRPFKLGYVSCCQGDAWITVHTHVNIVAVALMADIPCIIIPEGIEVEEATIKKSCGRGHCNIENIQNRLSNSM